MAHEYFENIQIWLHLESTRTPAFQDTFSDSPWTDVMVVDNLFTKEEQRIETCNELSLRFTV